LAFDSKKDLSCGMPISAGVSDTAQYKGKLYGFCSAECKADFLKDAEALWLKQNKWGKNVNCAVLYYSDSLAQLVRATDS
jgi:YHS domain-containing protein